MVLGFKVSQTIALGLLCVMVGASNLHASTPAPTQVVTGDIERLKLQVKLSSNELEKQKVALARLEQTLHEKGIKAASVTDGVYVVAKKDARGFWQAAGDIVAGAFVITLFTGSLVLAVLCDEAHRYYLVDRYGPFLGSLCWYMGDPYYYWRW